MHRCLSVLEILELICSHLDGLQRWPALAALARTCRSFSGPALCVLWQTHLSLAPFLKLMPADLIRKSADFPRKWNLIRPITVSDWDRPNVFAPRVRELVLQSQDWNQVADIFPILSACAPLGVIFPNLRSLTCYIMSVEAANLPSIRSFFSLTLQEIKIICRWNVTSISLISALPITCPTVKHVSVSCTSSPGGLGRTTSLFVKGLHYLVSLSLGGAECNSAVISHLGQLSTLTKLELVSLPDIFSFPPTSTADLFPNLRTLSFSATEVVPVITFFSMCSDTPFALVFVTFKSHPTAADTERFFHILKLGRACATLQSLTLAPSYFASAPPDTANYILSGASLHNLAHFRALEHFNLWTLALDVDDTAVANLVASWPRLKTLHLVAMTIAMGQADPKTTLQSLWTIAKSCPDLTSLFLQIDATHIPTTHPIRVVQESLDELNVGLSTITEPTAVARYLSSLFPNLTNITTRYDGGTSEDDDEDDEPNPDGLGRRELWKQVESQIPHFVAARREEVAWGSL
ncbi:hypothetical protein R3P38DRAFT_1317050 [Favolaschia claudopus]|uniref:F-box domain-containing protein n=1 Tax=Favolaschia claudopus TaxID=2862362 RepID=A0AAW0B0F1_9AGAR